MTTVVRVAEIFRRLNGCDVQFTVEAEERGVKAGPGASHGEHMGGTGRLLGMVGYISEVVERFTIKIHNKYSKIHLKIETMDQGEQK